MKSFLLKNGTPTIKWSSVPDGLFYEGKVPEGYDLAVCPGRYIILDVDVKNDKNGFLYIEPKILKELKLTFNYKTKSGGAHFWMLYSGFKTLKNTSTKFGLDLRIGEKQGNAGGYVKYHHDVDIRECEHMIQVTSTELNNWLESLFS